MVIARSRRLLLAAVLAIAGVAGRAHAQATQPNILFILADNLGYGEIGAYGGGATRGRVLPVTATGSG